MKTRIEGAPAFAYLEVELAPGEAIIAESDAMASMHGDLDVTARLNGGLIRALLKRFLGGESLFINEFRNHTKVPRRLTLVQGTPGDMREVQLTGESVCLERGAYICSTPGIDLGVQWAGFGSLIAREGLFKLLARGTGTLWYGSYGGLVEKQVDGEYIVDTSHLVAYAPGMKLKIQMAGGLFASILGGEGLVTRIEGQGKVVLQTRSLSGLAGWINPKL